MLELFQALAALDGREIGRQTLRFSGDAQTCPDPSAFLNSLQVRVHISHTPRVTHAVRQASLLGA